MGIPIETEMEDHGGTYKGRHARYRLARVDIVTLTSKEAAD
jgi:hypothetical protein